MNNLNLGLLHGRPIDPPDGTAPIEGCYLEPESAEPADDIESRLSAMLGNITLRIKMLELEQDRVRGALEALRNDDE